MTEAVPFQSIRFIRGFWTYCLCGEAALAWTASPYSHSMVPGGFDVMS